MEDVLQGCGDACGSFCTAYYFFACREGGGQLLLLTSPQMTPPDIMCAIIHLVALYPFARIVRDNL